MPNGGKPIEILVVEDNPGDVRLMRENFKEIKLANDLRVVKDGMEALQYLRRQAPYAAVEPPDLILLDLNLPKMNGRELLAMIKADPQLKRIPVIILSSSDAQNDIRMAYDLHANCYITKPGNLDDFIAVIRSIEAFWISIVKLPTK